LLLIVTQEAANGLAGDAGGRDEEFQNPRRSQHHLLDETKSAPRFPRPRVNPSSGRAADRGSRTRQCTRLRQAVELDMINKGRFEKASWPF
jgi:hypothetical protein